MEKKRRTKKIITASIVFVLLVLILMIISLFTGNPVSGLMARNKARLYINENYSALNLKIQKTGYNAKDGNYAVGAASGTSQDTHFQLFYRKGEIYRDSYTDDVLSGQNTWVRLSREYAQNITPVLQEKFGEALTSVSFIPKKEIMNSLPLDVPFSKDLIVDGELKIYYRYTQTDSQYLSDILVNAHHTATAAGYAFASYSLAGENQKTLVEISGVTPAQVESGQLEELIETAKASGQHDGIHVFTKGGQ